MVKQRFSTSDVAAEVGCLRAKVLGMRLANLYDVDSKTYLLKLARSGDDGDKVFLVLESGSRFHTTQWSKDKAGTPSNFTLKLRKHLRTRRLEDVRQLGTDRIVDFTFGSGEARHHLILELFSQGNLILTDSKYEILTLLRSYRDDMKGVAIMARHSYPLQTVRLPEAATREKLLEASASRDEKVTVRGAVLQILPFGVALADHTARSAGLDPHAALKDYALSSDQESALLAAVQAAEKQISGFSDNPPKGFIWQTRQGTKRGGKKQNDSQPPNASNDSPLMYSDFDATCLKQNEGLSVLEFPTFDAALDDFYSKIEGQKAEASQAQQEGAVLSKVEKIRQDQARRADLLEQEAKEEELKATLIQYNLEAVDGAIGAVRGALASGLNWKELKRLIKTEREAGNPVAALIHSLELEQNRTTLLLSNFLDEEEGDDTALMRPATKVEIDLDLNAHANARVHFESRRGKAAKQQKTVEQNERALKAAEKTAQKKLTQVKSAAKTAQQLRKACWFEKFHWFITSENYLVISGRDMQQNELLVKRYLGKDDIYVHAELHGASTTIVKNHTPGSPVPPMSIAQAGCACVCRSKAWDAKIVTSAWWVHQDQVSKTAPTGEYLPTGSFIIRGKKNFLPPQPLIMGLSFLFRLDESSLAAHVGERAVRGLDDSSTIPPQPDHGASGGEGSLSDDSASSEQEAADSNTNNLEAPAAAQNSALDAFMEGSADLISLSHRRYGLPDPAFTHQPSRPSDDEAAAPLEDDKPQQHPDDAQRHLSAHERRLAKKGGSALQQSTPEEAAALAEARKAERLRREAKQQAELQNKAEAAAASVRGKKGKLKKAQLKYAEQDEEDRQLALQLLDPAGKKKGKAEKKEARKARRQEADDSANSAKRQPPPTIEELLRVGAHIDQRGERAANGNEQGSHPAATPAYQKNGQGVETQRPVEATALAAENASKPAEAASANGGGAHVLGEGGQSGPHTGEDAGDTSGAEDSDGPEGSQHSDEERDGQEAAEVAEILEEEHVELLPEAELARLREIDTFTGQPRVDDTLLHALPVCAPYAALQSYKYRVKLTPGTQRKGKAGKQAVELLLRGPEVPSREKELMKGVSEMEIVNAMLGAVKISMPGLQKIKNEARSQKKRSKAAN